MGIAALFALATGCKKEEPVGNLKCEYTQDITLTNQRPGVDYTCDCIVGISGGTFTVEPGTEIEFTSGGALHVTDQGVLRITGTEQEPVILRGSTPGAGTWKGIAIDSEMDANEISHARISDAGNWMYATTVAGFNHDHKAGIGINGKAKITHTTVTGCEGYGIAFLNPATSLGFANNAINNCTDLPLFIFAGQLNNTNLPTCTFTGNAKNYIGIYARNSNSEVHDKVDMLATTVPYYALSSLSFNNQTTMAEGTVLVMAPDLAIYVHGEQFLRINGTATRPVTIRGEAPGAGTWRGILVNTDHANNIFNYLNISGGGSEKLGIMPNKANIALADVAPALLTINNCTSTEYVGHQLSVSGTDGQLTNNSPAITDIAVH